MMSELFRGQLIRLAAQDADKDAETLARWSNDSEYLRLLASDPARPQTAKHFQDGAARRAARQNDFDFHIPTLPAERFVGVVACVGGHRAALFLSDDLFSDRTLRLIRRVRCAETY